MLRNYLLPLFVVVISSSIVLPTTHAGSIEDEGWWSAMFAQGDIEWLPDSSNRWRWWLDGHARFHDDANGFNVSIVRPGIGYKLTDNTTVWAGYGWIRTNPINGAPNFDENRIWQQVTWSEQAGDFRVGLRSRFEQRFVEIGDDTGLRFRQFASARAPVTTDKRLTFVTWDEVFIHLNDTDFGTRTGFNQNRAFVGFGWNRCPETTSRIEFGYLNQYIDSRTGLDRMNHLLSVNVFVP